MQGGKMGDWPVYYRERLWLGNVDKGYIGIATLWTPKEKVAKFIDEELKEKIAVIGQLYTKRGVEYIFRNIYFGTYSAIGANYIMG